MEERKRAKIGAIIGVGIILLIVITLVIQQNLKKGLMDRLQETGNLQH